MIVNILDDSFSCSKWKFFSPFLFNNNHDNGVQTHESGFAHCEILMSFEQVGLELASCFLKFRMLLDSIYSVYLKKKSWSFVNMSSIFRDIVGNY